MSVIKNITQDYVGEVLNSNGAEQSSHCDRECVGGECSAAQEDTDVRFKTQYVCAAIRRLNLETAKPSINREAHCRGNHLKADSPNPNSKPGSPKATGCNKTDEVDDRSASDVTRLSAKYYRQAASAVEAVRSRKHSDLMNGQTVTLGPTPVFPRHRSIRNIISSTYSGILLAPEYFIGVIYQNRKMDRRILEKVAEGQFVLAVRRHAEVDWYNQFDKYARRFFSEEWMSSMVDVPVRSFFPNKKLPRELEKENE